MTDLFLSPSLTLFTFACVLGVKKTDTGYFKELTLLN